MNKKQLVVKISGALNLSKADAERTFDTITNTILDALKADDSVKIAGFGTYKVAKRKARVGRNPRTGEQIQIAASQKVKFLPAKALKEVFNKERLFTALTKLSLRLFLYANTAYPIFVISVSY